MNKPFSLYLDLVRFLAAVLVVVSHFGQHGIVSASAQQLLPQLGREAVVIFFVLSGFVIAYTSGEKRQTFQQYAVARCARLYCVVLPILLATILLALLTKTLYRIPVDGSYQLDKLHLYLPLHLMFAGQLWSLSETPPWLVPYWSLGYEAWYYVLFGVLFYARGKARIALAAAVLIIMGPKLWLLLPVWLSGVMLYRYRERLQLNVRQDPLRPLRGLFSYFYTSSAVRARIGWLLTLLALALYKVFGAGEALRALGIALWPFPDFALGSADRYLADYVVGLIVCLNFLFASQSQFARLERWSAPVRAVAGYTFTLYLIHTPVMGLWRALYPHDVNRWTDIAALSMCIVLACYVFGFVTERRKDAFRILFERLFERLLQRLFRRVSGAFAKMKP